MFDCTQTSDLPSIELLLGSSGNKYWFEIRPEHYVEDFNGVSCKVEFAHSSVHLDTWYLGNTFMKGYYVIHKYEDSTIGIVPFTGSSKSPSEAMTTEPTEGMFTNINDVEMYKIPVP